MLLCCAAGGQNFFIPLKIKREQIKKFLILLASKNCETFLCLQVEGAG
jgi:hypothetical protein